MQRQVIGSVAPANDSGCSWLAWHPKAIRDPGFDGWGLCVRWTERLMSAVASFRNDVDDEDLPDVPPRFTPADIPEDLVRRLLAVTSATGYDGKDLDPPTSDTELVEIAISACADVERGVSTWRELVDIDIDMTGGLGTRGRRSGGLMRWRTTASWSGSSARSWRRWIPDRHLKRPANSGERQCRAARGRRASRAKYGCHLPRASRKLATRLGDSSRQ
jgi:hypothetical protein